MTKRTSEKPLPIFYVTQAHYDDATDEERKTMKVCEKILPPPHRYTPAK